jgi:predicted dehydrogenase
MNIAVVGAGLVAVEAHLPAWSQVDGARVEAIVDADPGRARSVAAGWGVPTHRTDYRAVIADPRIHALDVCLPPGAHADCAVEALAAGKHVLLEKPFVTTFDEASRVLEAERASSATLMVAENWSFASSTSMVRELLGSGDLGEPFLLRAHHEGTLLLDAAEGTMPDWLLRTETAGGGYLMNAGIHMIHLARELMGELASLSCYTTADAADAETVLDYDAVLAGEFDSGALASMNFTARSRHVGERRLAFALFCTEGTVDFDVLSGEVAWTADNTRRSVQRAGSSMGYVEEIAHFVACCRDGVEPRTCARDQTMTLATVLAAYRSMRLGRPVAPGELLAEAGLHDPAGAVSPE